MYTSFSIENFRLFDQLTVEPLARVNLIAGQNNAGKTALLEALWLLSYATAPRQALRIANWRESIDYTRGSFFADLFQQYQTDLTIRVQAVDGQTLNQRILEVRRQYRAQQMLLDLSEPDDGDQRIEDVEEFDFESELTFDYLDDNGAASRTSAWLDGESRLGKFRPMLRESRKLSASPGHRCVFEYARNRMNSRTLAANFGSAEIEGALPVIEETIRLLEPRLKRLTTIADIRGFPSIYADIGASRLFPLSVMGDGTKRLLALCLSFLRAQHGVLLVDEIEDGLHYSVLVDVWKNLDLLSRTFDVQVVATTHSYECIYAAHSAFKEQPSASDFAFFRLQRNYESNNIECVAYDDIEAFDYAMKYEKEVR
ncbi:MAG: AAA family ATPase [Chloroflexi bacterium]|nr:AAA family ATPase [Chloroflexota bacterium]